MYVLPVRIPGDRQAIHEMARVLRASGLLLLADQVPGRLRMMMMYLIKDGYVEIAPGKTPGHRPDQRHRGEAGQGRMGSP